MISKQTFKILTILILSFGWLNAAADPGPHITVGSGAEVTGSATPVVVDLEYHAGASVVGIQAEINFDDTNLTVDLSDCGGANIPLLATVSCSLTSPGVVRVLVDAFDITVPLLDGLIGQLSFDVSSAAVATYALGVSAEVYADTVPAPVPGTGSVDGQVDVTAAGGLTDQTITGFVAAPASGGVGDSSTLSATADSGLTVTFGTSTPAICTVSGSSVSLVAAGTCTVTADQAGNASFNPAPQVTLNITVAGGLTDQVITEFVVVAGDVGDSSTLSATADSGLTVTFGTSTPAICTVTSSSVTYDAVGTCTVTLDQAGDANFNPAPQVTVGVLVGQGDQTISAFSAAPLAGNIGSTSNLSATASSGLPITFASDTPAICTVAGNVVTYIALGQCELTADQPGDANYTIAPQEHLNIDVIDALVLPAIAIPTLSATGLTAMFLLMLGLGGLVIRRVS